MIQNSLKNQIILWAGVCLLVSNFSGIACSVYILNRQAVEAHTAAITAGEEKARGSALEVAAIYEDYRNAALFASRVVEEAVSTGIGIETNNEVSKSPRLNRGQATALLKNVLIQPTQRSSLLHSSRLPEMRIKPETLPLWPPNRRTG